MRASTTRLSTTSSPVTAFSKNWPAPTGRSGEIHSFVRGSTVVDPNAWLKSVINAAWIPGTPEDEASYLMVLDRALLDRSISRTEGRQLMETAELAGLSRETVGRLHHDYLRSVAQEALADAVVTDSERVDLEAVATALGLGLPYVDEALAWAAEQAPSAAEGAGFRLEAGDRIVFTGPMSKPRDEWVRTISARGLASGGITRSTKLLVSSDPDSMSGKAAKARQHGVAIVDEPTFVRYFELYMTSN